MTPTEDGSPFVASEACDTSMLCMISAVGTGRQDSGPVYSSTFRVWVRLLRAFDCMLVQPMANAPRPAIPSSDLLEFFSPNLTSAECNAEETQRGVHITRQDLPEAPYLAEAS